MGIGALLRGIMADRKTGDRAVYQLSSYHSLDLLREKFTVRMDEQDIYHIYDKNDSGVEMTFELQGYLIHYQLPVFQKHDRLLQILIFFEFI
jgi:hypothetical protein